MRQFFVVVHHTFSSSVSDAGNALVILDWPHKRMLHLVVCTKSA